MKRLSIIVSCFLLSLLLTRDAASQSKVYRNVSNEGIETILQSFKIKYEKSERKEKDALIGTFEFKRGDHAFRLNNYGTDLWIECIYERALPPEDVNRWNAEAKFSRLVIVKQKDRNVLSLESQLDCIGGVTDAIIRQYIQRFEEEANRFAKFAK